MYTKRFVFSKKNYPNPSIRYIKKITNLKCFLGSCNKAIYYVGFPLLHSALETGGSDTNKASVFSAQSVFLRDSFANKINEILLLQCNVGMLGKP